LIQARNREKHTSEAKALLILLVLCGINPQPTDRADFSAAFLALEERPRNPPGPPTPSMPLPCATALSPSSTPAPQAAQAPHRSSRRRHGPPWRAGRNSFRPGLADASPCFYLECDSSRLLEIIRERNSTILFVNSRQVAERLAGALNELAGEPSPAHTMARSPRRSAPSSKSS